MRIRFPAASGALTDRGWLSMIDPDHLAPLDSLVRGVDPHLWSRVVDDGPGGWTVEISRADEPFAEASEVAITRFSTGVDFQFTDRGIPLPLTVV